MQKQFKTALSITTILSLTALSAIAAKGPSILEHLPVIGGAQAGNDFSIIALAKPGEKVDIKQAVVKGKYTIVDFQSYYCPDCRKMKPELESLAKARPDIAVRLVDINRNGFKGIDWKSPVALQYKIREIPQFKLYGPGGELLGQGDAAMNQVLACMAKELPAGKKSR